MRIKMRDYKFAKGRKPFRINCLNHSNRSSSFHPGTSWLWCPCRRLKFLANLQILRKTIYSHCSSHAESANQRESWDPPNLVFCGCFYSVNQNPFKSLQQKQMLSRQTKMAKKRTDLLSNQVCRRGFSPYWLIIARYQLSLVFSFCSCLVSQCILACIKVTIS